MRYAVSCVVCSGALPAKARADCRYCGIRCRVRAYRIRTDGGGCLRSDAQRREARDVRAVLRAAETVAADRESQLREAKEWAALLEEDHAAQRREVERLQLALLMAEETAVRVAANVAQQLAAAASDMEQAREEARRMQLRLDETNQALAAEQHSAAAQRASEQELRRTLDQTKEALAEARRADAKRTKSHQVVEKEANQMVQLAEMQREEIVTLGAQVRRLTEEREALRHIKQQTEADAGPREATIRALVEQRDAMIAEAARLRVKLRKHAPRQNEVDALQATLAEREQERQTLRDTVKQQQQELATGEQRLATVEQERRALSESVSALESEQQRSAQARARLESQVSRLAEQLAKSEEDLKAWRRGAQFGVAKGIADSLLRVSAEYVESVHGSSPTAEKSTVKESTSVAASIPLSALPPTPQPAPPSAAEHAEMPIETEQDVLWRQRIRDAEQRGWDPQSDRIVLHMAQRLRDEDRRAKRQHEKGHAVTAQQIPPGSDRDYVAIRAAIDARVSHQSEKRGRWILKWFQLDPLSEGQLLSALMFEDLKRTQDLLKSGG